MVGLCVCVLNGNGGLGCGFFAFLSFFFLFTDMGFVIVFFLLTNLGFVIVVVFVWWILVAIVEVEARSVVVEVAVTIAIGFCGGCFYIILKYCIYYFK